MELKQKNIFFVIILLALIVISFFIIQGFISAILSAFVLAYLLLPVHKYLSRKIPGKISAGIIIILLIIIIVISAYFITSGLISQAEQYIVPENFNNIASRIVEFVSGILPGQELNESFQRVMQNFTDFLLNTVLSVITQLPGALVSLALAFLITFFLLIGWDRIINRIKDLIPVKKQELSEKISTTTQKIVYGFLLIAIIEFIISAIGFAIAGINFYLLFALLIAIAAFIPFFGPMAVWLPLFLINIFTGNFFSSVIILITGLILTIFIDNFLVHIIVGKKARIHPIIVLLGILGGFSLFGLFGFIIGPLILSITIDLIEFYNKKDFNTSG